MSDEREQAERRTEEAFSDSAWQDPRAAYRELLRVLREQDPDAFAEVVRDYEESVVRAIVHENADPVGAWLSWGLRLARRLPGGGRLLAIDVAGRAREPEQDAADGGAPAEVALLLHLPAASGAPAVVIAAPAQPSEAQRATQALLVEGRQAL